MAAAEPTAHLGSALEARRVHEIADLRCIAQRSGLHNEIRIRRVHGNRQIPLTGVKVDGLCTDQDERRPVRSQGL